MSQLPTALRVPLQLEEDRTSYPEATKQISQQRLPLRETASSDPHALQQALLEEQQVEREADRIYWQPLKAELEKLRRER